MADDLKHLFDLGAVEVSFVPQGAIRKKFLILKEDGSMIVNLKNLDEILKKTALKNETKIRAVMKDAGLSGDDASTLEAALRVLSTLGDKVSGATMAELNSLVGVGPAPVEADPTMDPVALAAKAGEKPLDPAAAAADPAACKPGDPGYVKKEDMPAEPIMKADGTLNETAIPAHLRPVIVALWSQNKEKDAALTAVKKELDTERDAKLGREYLEKAGELKFLPVKKEDLGSALKDLAIVAPKVYERVEAILKSSNEALSKSGAFNEVGSARQGEGTSGVGADAAYERIKAAALSQPIAKEKGMTPDAAMTHFISKTAEGRRQYSDYIKEKGN